MSSVLDEPGGVLLAGDVPDTPRNRRVVEILLEHGFPALLLAVGLRRGPNLLDNPNVRILVVRDDRWLTGLAELGDSYRLPWVDLHTGKMEKEPPEAPRAVRVTPTLLIDLN